MKNEIQEKGKINDTETEVKFHQKKEDDATAKEEKDVVDDCSETRNRTNRNNDLIIDEGFAVLNTFSIKNKENDPVPRYPFASFSNAMNVDSCQQRDDFIHDCHLTFTARTKDDDEAYSSG